MKVLSNFLPLLLAGSAVAAPHASPVASSGDYDVQEVNATPNDAGIAAASLEKRLPASCQAIIAPVLTVASSAAFVVFVNGAAGVAKRVCKLEGSAKCEEYADIIQDGFNLIWISGTAYKYGAAGVSTANELVSNSASRRDIASGDFASHFVQGLEEHGFGYSSFEHTPLPASGLKNRANEPALISRMVLRNVTHAGRAHDVAIHHYDDGTGQIHLPHDGQSLSNSNSSSSAHKRFNGAGFKIAFTSRVTTVPSTTNEGSLSKAVAQNWYREADAGINELIGFMKTSDKANFYWRIIPELQGFGMNYESVDVCGGMAAYLDD